MNDIFFNAKGKTHHLRIRPDVENGDITVYEALINRTDYVWFEGHRDLEIWELIELAVQSYLDYRVNETVELRKWEGNS